MRDAIAAANELVKQEKAKQYEAGLQKAAEAKAELEQRRAFIEKHKPRA